MFDHRGFLELARSLMSKSDLSEAELRTTIGRAYYFVFHHVRTMFAGHPESHKLYRGKGSSHTEAAKFMMRLHEDAGENMFILKDFRNKADYELATDINLKIAERALLKTHQIAAVIESLALVEMQRYPTQSGSEEN